MSTDYQGTLHGVSDRRVDFQPGLLTPEVQNALGPYFPMSVWNQQAERYHTAWEWFTGEALNETEGQTADGKPIYKFPLAVNPIRNFARKHAALLWGEAQDGPDPFVKSRITAKRLFSGNEPKPADVDTGRTLTELVNHVWSQSNGRALQLEAGVLSQFLGGYVLQLVYEPWNENLLIPLRIKGIIPDFFLPIWQDDDYWNLLEAYVIYKIPAAAAIAEYGTLASLQPQQAPGMYAIYTEHWTRDTYSISINGEPLGFRYNVDGQNMVISFANALNPWGFVPFVYIPHLREGAFWGSSHVDDLAGLIKELNKALADEGDAISGSVRRKRYISNVVGTIKERQLSPGTKATDLGVTPPTSKHEPKIDIEDPPNIAPGLVDYPDRLWETLVREGLLSDVFFGKDEGSQRSALTLAFRMLPSTSHARAERTFWNDGLNTMARFILKACVRHEALRAVLKQLGVDVPQDFLKRFDFAQDWASMVPRDREAELNEIVLRKQTNLISSQLALEKFGDVLNIPEELALIQGEQEQALQMAQKFAPQPGTAPGKPGQKSGQGGAKTDIKTPTATDSMKE